MADINQLKQILGKSKAIMNKVDSGDFTKGTIPSDIISENATASAPTKYYTSQRPKTIGDRYPNLENSGLPDVIKEAMVNNPIDIPEMGGGSFEITDDLLDHVNSNTNIKKTYNRNQEVQINEQQIRSIVRSEMELFMKEYYDKSVIKEEIQIKVGSTVFSGSLKPLPKKKRR